MRRALLLLALAACDKPSEGAPPPPIQPAPPAEQKPAPPPGPKEFFESMRAAYEKRDAKTVWAGMSAGYREGFLWGVEATHKETRTNPDLAQKIRKQHQLDRDPWTMEPDELAVAILRTSLAAGPPAPVVGKVTESGDRATVAVEFKIGGETRRRTLKLVRESGAWKLNESFW